VDLSFTLGLEVGIAALLVLAVFSLKPEYGLFFYGFTLGFPDTAIPLGTAINLRLDDGLIVFFLVRSLLWSPAFLTPGQRSIFKWQSCLAAACALSALVGFARGTPPAAYETIKMIGCMAILIALPRVLQSERRLGFLAAGMMCAGIALIFQITQRLGSKPANFLGSFQELKSAAAFTTWNPNTIGQASILLVFAAGLGWISFRQSRINSGLWFCFATAFSLIPALVFSRGAGLSIAAGYVFFLFLVRRWKFALAFLLIGVSILGYLRSIDNELVDSATRVDVTTGEGFSHRFDRWDMATEAIRSDPFLGHGFGQEWTYLSGIGSEGRAHNAYMTIWIELGLGGLAVLLAATYRFVSSAASLYRDSEFQMCGALLLALSLTVCLDSFGSSTLYWEKLPTIAQSIGIALIGICERNRVCVIAQDAYALEYEVLPVRSRI
jgi:O-antigen ligase